MNFANTVSSRVSPCTAFIFYRKAIWTVRGSAAARLGRGTGTRTNTKSNVESSSESSHTIISIFLRVVSLSPRLAYHQNAKGPRMLGLQKVPQRHTRPRRRRGEADGAGLSPIFKQRRELVCVECGEVVVTSVVLVLHHLAGTATRHAPSVSARRRRGEAAAVRPTR